MVQVFDTHKFLFTLNYENKIEDLSIIFIDKSGNEKQIELKKIIIGTSPISCKLFDKDDNCYTVAFLRIRKVLKKGELIWDNTDVDLSNFKTIKGF